MPLPVINFSANPVLGDPFQSGLPQAIMQSLQMSYAPKMMQQDLIKQQLANKIAQAQAGVAPDMAQAELAFKQAETPHLNAETGLLGAQQGLTNQQAKYFGPSAMASIALQQAQLPLINAQAQQAQFNANNPLLSQPGTAGQLGALQYMQTHPDLFGSGQQNSNNQQQIPGMGSSGETTGLPSAASNFGNNNVDPNNFADMMRQSIMANIKGTIARGNLAQQQATAYAYTKLPLVQRNQMISQASGMGIDPAEAARMFADGYTVKDLAEMNGFDPKNLPDPIYPATGQDLNRIKQRQQAVNELNTIMPVLTEALGPYSQRIGDYSPKQIMQAISGQDPDAQAKFLAAKGLIPEMAALRTKAAGGQVGIEAIREIQKASMGNLKTFQSLVSPEVYKKANEYMDQWINMGTNRANSIALNPQKQFYLNQGQQVGAPNMSNGGYTPQNGTNMGMGIGMGMGSNAISQAMNQPIKNADSKSIGGKTYNFKNGKWYEK